MNRKLFILIANILSCLWGTNDKISMFSLLIIFDVLYCKDCDFSVVGMISFTRKLGPSKN